jgi:hypothetical protein
MTTYVIVNEKYGLVPFDQETTFMDLRQSIEKRSGDSGADIGLKEENRFVGSEKINVIVDSEEDIIAVEKGYEEMRPWQ